MKYLKIILIIVFLSITFFAISYGDGTITSDDKVIDFEEYKIYNTLDEWFTQLSLQEKIDVYNYWTEK